MFAAGTQQHPCSRQIDRRGDDRYDQANANLLQGLRVQQAQERYRATQPSYAGSLDADGLNMPATSPSGHYLVSSAAASGAESSAYVVRAQAQGPQAQDLSCRYMVVNVTGGQLTYSSGADADAGNTGTANRACWGQP